MKKKLMFLLIILLLIAADVYYWTAAMSLGQQLPAKVWGQAQLWHCTDGGLDSPETELSEEDFGRIAAALKIPGSPGERDFRPYPVPGFI